MLFDLEKEKVLISTCLYGTPDAIVDIMDLNPDDFYNSEYRSYFAIMKECYGAKIDIGLMIVREGLLEKHSLELAERFVNEFVDYEPYSIGVSVIVDAQRELTKKRQLAYYLKAVCQDIIKPSVKFSDTALDIENEINSINQNSKVNYLTYDGSDDVFDFKGEYIKCGIDGIDDKIIGLFRGDLIVLSAKTSRGKSTLALNFCQNNPDKNILFFSEEMKVFQMKQRILSSECKIQLSRIRAGNLTPDEKMKLRQMNNHFTDKYKNLKFYYKLKSIEKIEQESKKEYLKSGQIDLVVIDYLQKLKSKQHTNDRRLQVGHITDICADISGDCNCPVLLVSQLSRIRDDEKPELRHLKESGEIENSADVVMFIYNDYKTNKDYILYAKNRQGEARMQTAIHYQPDIYLFQNDDREY